MPPPQNYDPHGPSNLRLFVTGSICLALVTLVVVAAIAKSKGKLDTLVPVTAALVDVGDGLPARSDVKFHGVLVGSVSEVVAAQVGRPNLVHIDLKPEFVPRIPNSVSARVVPSNVFAVSSVELIDDGRNGRPIAAGAVIPEDDSLPTLVFQSALNKARELFRIVGRNPTDESVGVLTALGEATQGRGQNLTDAGHDLNEVMSQLNSVVAADPESTTMSAVIAAADGLRQAAPELFDTLGAAVKPMQTFAQERATLTSFLSAGQHTLGTVGDAFDHQTDRLIHISTGLAPAIGVLADHSGDYHSMFVKTQQVANQFYDVAWNPQTNTFLIKAVIGLTPGRTYVRADCPRYGELAGPSCTTAPETPTAPALLPALDSMGYPAPAGIPDNRPNFAPPRGSIVGVPDVPAESAPPAQPAGPAAAEPGAGPLPAEAAPPSGAPLPAEVAPQSAVFGGTVGPVGSGYEKEQLARIIGRPPNAATQLLLGPLARGTNVDVARNEGSGQ